MWTCKIVLDKIATTFTTSNSMKKLFGSVQVIIFKMAMFLILLFCVQNILSIVADMKKSNLIYVHLERSWKKRIQNWSTQPKVETDPTWLLVKLGLLQTNNNAWIVSWPCNFCCLCLLPFIVLFFLFFFLFSFLFFQEWFVRFL